MSETRPARARRPCRPTPGDARPPRDPASADRRTAGGAGRPARPRRQFIVSHFGILALLGGDGETQSQTADRGPRARPRAPHMPHKQTNKHTVVTKSSRTTDYGTAVHSVLTYRYSEHTNTCEPDATHKDTLSLSFGRSSLYRRLEDEPRRGRAVHLRPSSAAIPRQDLSVSVLQLLDLTLQILDLPGEPRPFRHRLGRDGRTRCLGVDRCEPSSPRHAPTVAPQPLMETGTARALFWGAQSSPTRSGGPWHFGQAAPPPHPGRTPPPV